MELYQKNREDVHKVESRLTN